LISYRCYLLDNQNRISGVHELDAASDIAASERARTVLAGEPQHFTAVEVWNGARKVDYAAR
jgi:hypothetical protein